METVIFLFVLFISSMVIFSFLKHGSLRGMVFGSKIVRTIGEPLEKRPGFGYRAVRVHELLDGKIGVELTAKRGRNTAISGFSVSRDEALRLIGYLQEACE